ncbi:MAG: SDR family oxidoreductase [Gammaproteobacteria bacterium]|nr:SDR family oxidoreductase [Gammaproteobacteria bacterium]
MSTALITGASSGIGLELAKLMAKDGMDLILVARSANKLSQLAQDLQQQYRIQVTVIAQDLCQPNAVSALTTKLDQQPIDILVNNAGCGDFGLFQDVEWRQYHQTIQLNMTALTELTHAVLPQMIARNQGKIVNIASTAAFQPLPWMAVYAATKSYVLSLSEALAFELRHTGVDVLAICPGATKTGFASAANGVNSNNFADQNTASATDVAQFVVQKINRQHRGVAVHGFKNLAMSYMSPLSPKAIVLRMAERVMRPSS